jgi:hypothetical protein
MRYTINHDINKGVCVVTVSGELKRPDDSIRLQELAYNFRSKKGCKRFLFDMSQANIIGQGYDTFQVGVAPVEKGADRSFAIALVYSGNMQEHEFMENVLVNRGFNVRVFDNINVAFEWLAPKLDNT